MNRTPHELKTKIFTDIPKAARFKGISVRHFRRLLEDENVPIIEINRKYFLLIKDIENLRLPSKRFENTPDY